MQQEEGVLKDVLEELDRERTRRAELELKVYQLAQENEGLLEAQRIQKEQAQTAESAGVSYAAFRALQAEIDAYRQIIDALTLGKPAIAAAAQAENIQAAIQNKKHNKLQSTSSTKQQQPQQQQQSSSSSSAPDPHVKCSLPLHVVRLLEVLPWEARTQQHIIAMEQIYEWQVYKDHRWQSHIKFFPIMFKTLRLVKATSISTAKQPTANSSDMVERQHTTNPSNKIYMQILSGTELQKRNKQRVLTDESITVLFDTDAGFPLPTSGGVWEWIGSWRVVKANAELFASSTTDHHDGLCSSEPMVCDENGWTYVENPRDFITSQRNDNKDPSQFKLFRDPGFVAVPTSDHQGVNNKKLPPQRLFRRRKWIRQRNLVDYPFASESTRQYLRLLADKARQQNITAKINDQLIQTKATLTEVEERFVKAKYETLDASLQPSDPLFEIDQDDTKKLEEELVGGESYSSSVYPLRSPVFERSPIDKLTLWVQQHQHLPSSSTRKASEDITLSDDSGTEDGLGTDSTHSDSTSTSKNHNFDWKKLSRSQLMQKLKRNAGGISPNVSFPRAFRQGPGIVTTEQDDLML